MSLYRDGVFVGRGQMTLTPKDETVRLGFGADDKIKIAWRVRWPADKAITYEPAQMEPRFAKVAPSPRPRGTAGEGQ